MGVISGWITGLAKRARVQRAVWRLDDGLLDELGPIDFGGEVVPEDEPRWELATDLDALQAAFAGSLFWKLNRQGRAARARAQDRIELALARANALRLGRTVDRLQEIRRALHSMR